MINMGPPVINIRTDLLRNSTINHAEKINHFRRSLNNRESSTINSRLSENRKHPLSATKALITVNPRPQSDIVMTNSSSLLPDIMASSCPMHSKYDQRNYDMAMITTYHGGDTKYELFRTENRHQAATNLRLMDQQPRVIAQPVYKRQVLPNSVDINIFVNSWLLDGTNPELKRHFSALE